MDVGRDRLPSGDNADDYPAKSFPWPDLKAQVVLPGIAFGLVASFLKFVSVPMVFIPFVAGMLPLVVIFFYSVLRSGHTVESDGRITFLRVVAISAFAFLMDAAVVVFILTVSALL